jgi:hypothetical protein
MRLRNRSIAFNWLSTDLLRSQSLRYLLLLTITSTVHNCSTSANMTHSSSRSVDDRDTIVSYANHERLSRSTTTNPVPDTTSDHLQTNRDRSSVYRSSVLLTAASQPSLNGTDQQVSPRLVAKEVRRRPNQIRSVQTTIRSEALQSPLCQQDFEDLHSYICSGDQIEDIPLIPDVLLSRL